MDGAAHVDASEKVEDDVEDEEPVDQHLEDPDSSGAVGLLVEREAFLLTLRALRCAYAHTAESDPRTHDTAVSSVAASIGEVQLDNLWSDGTLEFPVMVGRDAFRGAESAAKPTQTKRSAATLEPQLSLHALWTPGRADGGWLSGAQRTRAAYIKRLGAAMVSDVEREGQLVQELLQFKERLDLVLSSAVSATRFEPTPLARLEP